MKASRPMAEQASQRETEEEGREGGGNYNARDALEGKSPSNLSPIKHVGQSAGIGEIESMKAVKRKPR